MRPLTPTRLLAYCGITLLVWALIAGICLGVGSTGFGWSSSTIELRIDRILVASLVGLGLGAGGVGYQSVLRNPLADPYLLGASSGAAL
ncbi:MAG: iron chelate uptake ABC transporter family permease subunit [Planctomycetota bacterium]